MSAGGDWKKSVLAGDFHMNAIKWLENYMDTTWIAMARYACLSMGLYDRTYK